MTEQESSSFYSTPKISSHTIGGTSWRSGRGRKEVKKFVLLLETDEMNIPSRHEAFTLREKNLRGKGGKRSFLSDDCVHGVAWYLQKKQWITLFDD